jgi:hypothetical protein
VKGDIMKSTIRQFLEGGLPTFEQLVPIGAEHRELTERLCGEEEYFHGVMPPEAKDRFGDYLDMQNRLIEESNAEAFTYGFKLAVRMMSECFGGEDKI